MTLLSIQLSRLFTNSTFALFSSYLDGPSCPPVVFCYFMYHYFTTLSSSTHLLACTPLLACSTQPTQACLLTHRYSLSCQALHKLDLNPVDPHSSSSSQVSCSANSLPLFELTSSCTDSPLAVDPFMTKLFMGL